jgi:hypothetical protein
MASSSARSTTARCRRFVETAGHASGVHGACGPGLTFIVRVRRDYDGSVLLTSKEKTTPAPCTLAYLNVATAKAGTLTCAEAVTVSESDQKRINNTAVGTPTVRSPNDGAHHAARATPRRSRPWYSYAAMVTLAFLWVGSVFSRELQRRALDPRRGAWPAASLALRVAGGGCPSVVAFPVLRQNHVGGQLATGPRLGGRRGIQRQGRWPWPYRRVEGFRATREAVPDGGAVLEYLRGPADVAVVQTPDLGHLDNGPKSTGTTDLPSGCPC